MRRLRPIRRLRPVRGSDRRAGSRRRSRSPSAPPGRRAPARRPRTTSPTRVRIPVFVRETDGELHLLARVPLLLLLSLNVPKWGAGYLDLERADPVLPPRRGSVRRRGAAVPSRWRQAAGRRRGLPGGPAVGPVLHLLRVRAGGAGAEAASGGHPGLLEPGVSSTSTSATPAPESGQRLHRVRRGSPVSATGWALDLLYERPDPDGGGWKSNLFHISVREGRVALDPSPVQAVLAFGRSGVEHILTGLGPPAVPDLPDRPPSAGSATCDGCC